MTRAPDIRDEKGQALTELALVLPVLCLLLFAIVQFGIAFNHYLTLTDAVRAGARQAAIARFQADPAGFHEEQGACLCPGAHVHRPRRHRAPSDAWTPGS